MLEKMSRKRMLALGLKCMFCGAQADSNEHVFGEWMQKWIPSNLTGNHNQTITRFDTLGGTVEFADPEPFVHGGGPLTRKLPVTCSSCNNGWMSGLEKSIEPWLGPMVQSAPHTELTLDRQRELALWAEKTAMVWELTDDQGVVATQTDREFIRTKQKPTRNTEVWVGRCGAPERRWRVTHYFGRVKIFAPSAYGVDLWQSVGLRWDLIGIGEVMLLVSGATNTHARAVDPVLAGMPGYFDKLQRIWPPVTWPEMHPNEIATRKAVEDGIYTAEEIGLPPYPRESVIFPRRGQAPMTNDEVEKLIALPAVNVELLLRLQQSRPADWPVPPEP